MIRIINFLSHNRSSYLENCSDDHMTLLLPSVMAFIGLDVLGFINKWSVYASHKRSLHYYTYLQGIMVEKQIIQFFNRNCTCFIADNKTSKQLQMV